MIFAICTSSAYILLAKLLERHMLYREHYDIDIRMYNYVQILLNAYIIVGLINLPFLPKEPNIFAINTPYSNKVHHYVIVHYVTKYIDYVNTFIILLNGKRASFLHKYHRAVIPIVWSALETTGHANGTVAFIALSNSIVNLIMYSNHLLNRHKKLVTKAQMSLFIILVAHSVCIALYEQILPKEYAIIEFLYQIHMLTLFTNYYLTTYKRKLPDIP